MNIKLQLLGSVIAMFFTASGLVADENRTITVSVSDAQSVSLVVPEKWKHTVIQPIPQFPPTVKLVAADDLITLLITFVPDPEGRFTTREGIDRAVTESNQQYLSGSVEKRLELTQLESKQVRGCYTKFTDAALVAIAEPRKGQYRNVVSGLFVVDRQAATFTLLTNDTALADYRTALKIICDGIAIAN